MIANKRKILKLTLSVVGGAGYAGSIAARQRARKLQVKQQEAEEIQKWEGEGGNPPPVSVSSPVLMIYSPTASNRQRGVLPWPGTFASAFQCPLASP